MHHILSHLFVAALAIGCNEAALAAAPVEVVSRATDILQADCGPPCVEMLNRIVSPRTLANGTQLDVALRCSHMHLSCV